MNSNDFNESEPMSEEEYEDNGDYENDFSEEVEEKIVHFGDDIESGEDGMTDSRTDSVEGGKNKRISNASTWDLGVDLYSIQVFSAYVNREDFLNLMGLNDEVEEVLSGKKVNRFEFETLEDFQKMKVETYHTGMDKEQILLLKGMIEGKDIPKPKTIVVDFKDGEISEERFLKTFRKLGKFKDTNLVSGKKILQFRKLLYDNMKPETARKIENLIDYDKSKFEIKLDELNIEDPNVWKARILVHGKKPTGNEIDISMFTNLTSLGANVFQNGYELQRIILPNTIEDIQMGCFEGCTSLEYVNIPLGVTELGSCCFESCFNLRTIQLPSSIKEIGWRCFRECRSLGSIEFPKGLTKIGSECFSWCYGLTTVVIQGEIEELPVDCFARCYSLRGISIPEGIKTIEDGCFAICTQLEEVDLPETIEYLGFGCFAWCTVLQIINFPSSLQAVGKYCFYKCKLIPRKPNVPIENRNYEHKADGEVLEDLGLRMGTKFSFCFNDHSVPAGSMLPHGVKYRRMGSLFGKSTKRDDDSDSDSSESDIEPEPDPEPPRPNRGGENSDFFF